MTPTEQIDAVLHALAAGDHATAEAVADLGAEDVPDDAEERHAESVLREGAPGPPPSPGLVWNDGTHRWRDPHTGEETPHPAASGATDHPAVAGHFAELAKQAAAVPAGLASKVGNWVAGKYKSLEQKYGRAGAISVLVGMVVMAPIPAPGTVMIPVALAEGVKRLAAKLRGSGREKEGTLSPDELIAAAKEMLAELYREHGQEPPEFDESKAREWLTGE